MTAEEAEKLITVLKASGVRSFKDGAVEIVFDAPAARLALPPRPTRLPTSAVFAEMMPSPEELEAVD